MVFVRSIQPWQLSESQVSSETAFFSRRQVLKSLVGLGVTASILPLTGCSNDPKVKSQEELAFEQSIQLSPIPNYHHNGTFEVTDRPLTSENLSAKYNNFYEYGGTKGIWLKAQKLPLENWKVEVTGLVKYPKIFDIDDFKIKFPLEERIYRFRCVEAWSMVLPWVGFPMKELLKVVEPTAQAKYVSFTSYYNEKITTGPGFQNPLKMHPWPYREGLRIEEMANDLAFFAIGIYGHDLPKQHGAPLRMVTPWKYGFKGAKSIVKIEFLANKPTTYWNTLVPSEYDFEANVNPKKPHPRWSQATERFIGQGSDLSWTEKPTLLYNGYGDLVASLYL